MRKDRGLLKHDPERYSAPLKAALAERKSIDFVTELTDGRVIAIANRPMPDGRWVSTHDDITEQQRAEKRVARAEAAARRRAQQHVAGPVHVRRRGAADRSATSAICRCTACAESDLQPGITLVELLEKRRAQGHLVARPARIRRRTARRAGEGRARSPSPWKAPAAASSRSTTGRCRTGSWVSCHEDITERRKAEQQTRRTEAPARRGAQEHVARPVHVRCGRPGRPVQSALRRDDERLAANSWTDCTLVELMARRKAAGEFFGDPEAFARVGAPEDARRQSRDQNRRAQRRPRASGRAAADARRRLGRHARGHHRAAARRRSATAARGFARRRARERVSGPVHRSRRARLRYRAVQPRSPRSSASPREAMIGMLVRRGVRSAATAKARFRRADPEPSPQRCSPRSDEADDDHQDRRQVRSGRIHRIAVQPMPAGRLGLDASRRTHRKRAEARSRTGASRPLTGLPNRAAFNECLGSTIETRGQGRHLVRPDVARPRPLQGGQRRVRPRRRRRPAARSRAAPAEAGRRRLRGAARRRRIRHHRDRRRTAGGRGSAGRADASRRSPKRSTSTATSCAAAQHRHRDLPGRWRRRRRR